MSFREKLTSGEFVILAEMNTPKGIDISSLTLGARHLKSRVDAVVLPDTDNGTMHMSAMGSGMVMLNQGIEPMVHVCGRDRNRIALQSDLLSAHLLGIQNLLVVQAESMENSDHQDARPVDDLDESGIIRTIETLNRGTDLSGFELNGSPDFFAGCSLPPIIDEAHLDQEIEKIKEKADLGARFIVTPPIFNPGFYSRILDRLSLLKLPVIASVLLLKSVGMARYLFINAPEYRLSEQLISKMRTAKDRETEAIHIAGEMIRHLAPVCQGIRISALGWEDRLPAILDSAEL